MLTNSLLSLGLPRLTILLFTLLILASWFAFSCHLRFFRVALQAKARAYSSKNARSCSTYVHPSSRACKVLLNFSEQIQFIQFNADSLTANRLPVTLQVIQRVCV
jgi:hypothetical protein